MNAENQVFDALIIGGGPAGVSCAVWLARLGFAPLLLEAGTQIGGLCRTNPFHDDWNASLPSATSTQVADNLATSLAQAGVPWRLSYRVERAVFGVHGQSVVDQGGAMGPGRQAVSGGMFAVSRQGDDRPVYGRNLVLATGVRARGLSERADKGLPAESGAEILIGPGHQVVAHDFCNKRVAVLGGGDNAFENALFIADKGARQVQVYARTVRAQRQFVRRMPADCVFVGDYGVNVRAGTVNGIHYDVILVFYGWDPCVDFADSLALRRTGHGFIATDVDTAQTSCPGVYAIGEVAQRQHPCVVTALADGVTAAKALQTKIESRLFSA